MVIEARAKGRRKLALRGVENSRYLANCTPSFAECIPPPSPPPPRRDTLGRDACPASHRPTSPSAHHVPPRFIVHDHRLNMLNTSGSKYSAAYIYEASRSGVAPPKLSLARCRVCLVALVTTTTVTIVIARGARDGAATATPKQHHRRLGPAPRGATCRRCGRLAATPSPRCAQRLATFVARNPSCLLRRPQQSFLANARVWPKVVLLQGLIRLPAHCDLREDVSCGVVLVKDLVRDLIVVRAVPLGRPAVACSGVLVIHILTVAELDLALLDPWGSRSVSLFCGKTCSRRHTV